MAELKNIEALLLDIPDFDEIEERALSEEDEKLIEKVMDEDFLEWSELWGDIINAEDD